MLKDYSVIGITECVQPGIHSIGVLLDEMGVINMEPLSRGEADRFKSEARTWASSGRSRFHQRKWKRRIRHDFAVRSDGRYGNDSEMHIDPHILEGLSDKFSGKGFERVE